MSRDQLKLDDYLPYLVNRVGAALVATYTRRALAANKLSIDMWRVLAILSDNGGQRQIDLSSITSIEASTVSRIVTRLVRLGLVTRGRSETSNREVLVQLSPKGRALVKKLIPVALGLEDTAAGGVSAADLVQLKRTLRKIYANLANAQK
ncbi:MAG TPA: MarR family transcriptional regulator [Xanthobacteraceae bacterium]|nr:MarR family transcriptional regulator [Xanthobacteraceae bacterium]